MVHHEVQHELLNCAEMSRRNEPNAKLVARPHLLDAVEHRGKAPQPEIHSLRKDNVEVDPHLGPTPSTQQPLRPPNFTKVKVTP